MFLSNRALSLLGILGALSATCSQHCDGAEEPSSAYSREVRPLLQEKCFSCHSARKQEGGLRLDAAVLIQRGGDSGPAIKPGAAKASVLLNRITADDDERMPPVESGSRLTANEIRLLEKWIDSGAVAPDEAIPDSPTSHWSFQSPLAVTPPDAPAAWCRSDIDRFIAADHQRLGVTTVDPAERGMLLRRVSLALTGLPPTPDELRGFLNDKSSTAYESAVDRLLDSPRYGERWARHFMDVWRYSDPSGYGKEIRDGRQHIWRWRDWIVESLNADKGYDRMLVEMLAADEAAPDDPDALRATGFLARNWYKFNRNVWLDNIVEHSSKAFLGLTVNCARCHEHKYDPIEQVDYYRMRAIFEPHDVRDDPFEASAQLVRTYDAHLDRETFLFRQGNENRAETEHSLSPGIPDLLGRDLTVEPVDLPVTAWYPAIREEARTAALNAAESQIAAAETELKQSRAAVVEAQRQLRDFTSPVATKKDASDSDVETSDAATAVAFFEDDFTTLDTTKWQVESGEWTSKDGRLQQALGETRQHRLLSTIEHPDDFRANIRFRITGGDQYRSVGFGFDVHGRAMNAVYLSVSGAKAQFTSQGTDGRWQYPPAGAAAFPVKAGQDHELEVIVREQLLNVLVDGDFKVAFNLPAKRAMPRGKFCIWTFSATAEFDHVSVSQLSPTAELKPAGNKSATSPAPSKPPTRAALAAAVDVARMSESLAVAHLKTVESNRESLQARINAEVVKHGLAEGQLTQLQQMAGHAERQLALHRLEEQIADARLRGLKGHHNPPTDAKAIGVLKKLPEQIAALEQQLTQATAQLSVESTEYPALGPTWPQTSSGRRLAFARWVTDRTNPLTARVLVNHVWLRHFDTPLVERMFDFGLRSEQPRHAALLDWLAVQFMENDWSLKQLHKGIVMSGVYRLSSSAAGASIETREHDPDNHSLWRMNARRMEAEVVRDSVLYLGGSLDVTPGGPPVEHTQGQSVMRRSLYFRQDKERQMTFLSLFDGAKVNECYQRKATVAPQQALALFNSSIATRQSHRLSETYSNKTGTGYVTALFQHVLCRPPSPQELEECTAYLSEFNESPTTKQQLALVLLNHNDFVTIR